MILLHIVILALVQGITEFLPVSSSGHLILTHALLGTDGDQNDAMMDIAVHVGTLFAVLLYFRRDFLGMACGLRHAHNNPQNFMLPLYILIASVPVLAAGLLLHNINLPWMRSAELIGWNFIIFGIFLWLADRFRPHKDTLDKMTLGKALLIGLSQILALLPGTSRSGITMTAARALGFTRPDAARFSLFLAVIAISGAGFLGGIDILQAQDMALTGAVVIAIIVSFISSFAAIHIMMKWLERATFTPFVLYRIVFGVGLLALIYTGALS